MGFRITYSVLNADMSEIHREFDGALSAVRKTLGAEYPSWINGKAFTSGQFIDDKNPANTKELLGRFHSVPPEKLDEIFTVSRKAQKSWGKAPWAERVKLIRKAADLISERRLEISAIMSLEAGKNRLESLGDVEESADLFRYYATQLEEANGYVKPLGHLSPNERTQSVLKPYGIFVVVSPFNFPLALACGMSGAALLAGNSVILKPSQETPWTAQKMYECIRDAGIPNGVFQLVYGTGSKIGDALTHHPEADGVVFTGSKAVGMRLLQNMANGAFPKPVLLELGGKNPAIVCDDADLDKAVEGCARSAFGLSGQKCSALSRVYVHKSIKDTFVKQLIEKTRSFKIGDPTQRDVFVGPLINASALQRHTKAVESAKAGGKILFGGETLTQNPEFANGHFAHPTIVEVPDNHALTQDEIFSPFLNIYSFETLEDAVNRANDVDYGLTAGFFSESPKNVDYFYDHIEAGVAYSNRKTGATTGAWPGVQAFCGWKGSGSTGKGGCGPYYVSQFMREQSQTRME